MCRTLKLSSAAMLLLACGTMWLVFSQPTLCARTLQEGLALCSGSLLVSLFPFLIVSNLLMQCGAGELFGFLLQPVARIIGVKSPAAGGVLLIGLLGGFAPAANAAAQAVRSQKLTSDEASALLPACICSGPSFVILTVGEELLGSQSLGIQLFAAQVLAGYLTAAVLGRIKGIPRTSATLAERADALPSEMRLDAVIAQSTTTYGKLCGFVLYFRMLAAGVGQILPGNAAVVPAMLLEVCSGCDLASRTGLWASGMCCAALSVQGLSVLLQVRTICPPEISFRPLLAGRLLHLPLSLAFFYLGLPEQAVETFSTLCGRVVTMQRVPTDCALLAFFGCCLFAVELCKLQIKSRRVQE